MVAVVLIHVLDLLSIAEHVYVNHKDGSHPSFQGEGEDIENFNFVTSQWNRMQHGVRKVP